MAWKRKRGKPAYLGLRLTRLGIHQPFSLGAYEKHDGALSVRFLGKAERGHAAVTVTVLVGWQQDWESSELNRQP